MPTPFAENPPEATTPKRTRKPYTYPKMVSYVETEMLNLGVKPTDTVAAFIEAMKNAWFNEQKYVAIWQCDAEIPGGGQPRSRPLGLCYTW